MQAKESEVYLESDENLWIQFDKGSDIAVLNSDKSCGNKITLGERNYCLYNNKNWQALILFEWLLCP